MCLVDFLTENMNLGVFHNMPPKHLDIEFHKASNIRMQLIMTSGNHILDEPN